MSHSQSVTHIMASGQSSCSSVMEGKISWIKVSCKSRTSCKLERYSCRRISLFFRSCVSMLHKAWRHGTESVYFFFPRSIPWNNSCLIVHLRSRCSKLLAGYKYKKICISGLLFKLKAKIDYKESNPFLDNLDILKAGHNNLEEYILNINRLIRRWRRATNKSVLKNVYLNYILERPIIRSVREAKVMDNTKPLWSEGSD